MITKCVFKRIANIALFTAFQVSIVYFSRFSFGSMSYEATRCADHAVCVFTVVVIDRPVVFYRHLVA